MQAIFVQEVLEISASIVLYKHQFAEIADVIDAALRVDNLSLYILDNSPKNQIEKFLPVSDKIHYVFTGKNLGYGSAHNIALRKIIEKSKYHIVLNPDILFEPETIGQLVRYMDENINIGLIMPKVLYQNGEIQHLCKLLPTPFDLILRRFIPGFLKNRFNQRLEKYELIHKDYSCIMEVPNLSGCFMFLRTDVLKYVGLFDEKFFMYLEDTDLSRRINQQFKTIYYPNVSIVHYYEKGSYKSFKLLKYHIVSAFRYFNKYGWFYDTVRKTTNQIISQ